MAKNAEYWRGRFSMLENRAFNQSEQAIQDIEKIYQDAQMSIQKDIEAWYGRFATNNGISLTDARKMLTAGQLEEFRWNVDQYIQAGKQAALDPAWLKKLENASARVHISRLEALQLQIQQQVELLNGNQLDTIDSLLKKVVGGNYTHAAFEIQKGLGVGWDLTGLDQRKLEALISKPWTTDGRTFRDRCWTNKTELVNSLNREMVQGMLRGDSPEKAIQAIQKQFGVSRYKARRLVHTETSYFNACSTREVYKDLDVEKIEILETLDSRTCDICGALDGKVIKLSEYEPGITVPPFHPNCRGTTVPHYDDMDGERAARNADGEVYYVPADMTYQAWKAAFVDGGAKDGLTAMVVKAIITKGKATTTKEAEADAAQYAQQVKLRGVTNMDSLNEMTGTLDHLYQKYPQLNRLKEIQVKVNRKGSTMASANFQGLYPRSKFMNSPVTETANCFGDGWKPRLERVLESWNKHVDSLIQMGAPKADITKGKKVIQQVQEMLKYSRHNVIYAGKEVQCTITHEFGHVLADQLCGQINHKMANPAFAYAADNPLWKKCLLIDSTYQKAISTGDIYSISMYGASNSHEFFAECFTIYDMGEEQLPDYIVEMFKEVLEP
ncbi:MAG: minor capsid protein [Ruminococcus flavefaciens]|nr:minor capsid protein [Ruminococcus flavefaciens]